MGRRQDERRGQQTSCARHRRLVVESVALGGQTDQERKLEGLVEICRRIDHGLETFLLSVGTGVRLHGNDRSDGDKNETPSDGNNHR